MSLTSTTSEILVLYYSRHGTTKQLANYIGRGIEKVPQVHAKLRTVPQVSTVCEKTADDIPETGDIYAQVEDFESCSGLILGSPSYFGNMSSSLKYFIDSSSSQWLSGALVGKPGAVFTSGSGIHGGQETTLISMMLPLFHHGMLISGIPYSEADLSLTSTGGTPYGPSHVSGMDNKNEISEHERNLAIALGFRIAKLAKKLQS